MRHRLPIWLPAFCTLAACSPTEPILDGLVVVSVVTQGEDLPTTPYLLGVDSAPGRTIAANSITTLSGVAPGSRTIVLTEIPRNCSATEGTTRTIEVPEGGSERITFTLTCAPASANLTIRVDPVGTPTPGDEFIFTLDDGQVLVVLPGQAATAVVGHIGARYIGVTNVPRNCDGPNVLGPIRLTPNADTTITVSTVCTEMPRGIFYRGRAPNSTAVTTVRANPDGSGVVPYGPASVGPIAIRPGGDQVASVRFLLASGGYAYGIALTTPDGRRPRVVVGGATTGDIQSTESAAWSPDGRRLLFGNSGTGRPGYYILTPETGEIARVPVASFEGREVAWSPAEDLIAVIRVENRGNVWLTRPDGTEGRWLDPVSFRWIDRGMAWSPDGSRMAVIRVDYGYNEHWLDIITLATGEVRTVWRGGLGDRGRPSWSPDGREVLVTTYEQSPISGSSQWRIVAVDANDGTQRVIADPPPDMVVGYPVWY